MVGLKYILSWFGGLGLAVSAMLLANANSAVALALLIMAVVAGSYGSWPILKPFWEKFKPKFNFRVRR